MDAKYKFIQKLKQQYYNDYAVIIDSVVCGLSAKVYGDFETAKKHYKRIVANSDLLKPCTIQLKLLN